MPGAETVKLQVELVEKNAEARLRALDKLAKEMANRKITMQFDEASLAKWKTATEGMTNSQLSNYVKLAIGAENAAAKVVAAETNANAKVEAESKKSGARLVAQAQKSKDNIIKIYEQEDTKRRAIAAQTEREVIKANNKIEVATLKGVKGTRQQTQAQKDLNTEAQKTDGIFASITARFTAANLISSMITAAITRLKTALREAVTEMKEMDKELTTIKMVSGASDSYINQLTNQAFAGARANGRNVTDYLSAAEIFTRAGYRENIDQLSQLSLMTQNIGGVEEEVASKFLLAADAAWKLGGSYDALLGVLDGVSSVADQNATDLGKIAEGITVAGSAFANAGESAATFTAMLGTTTASTQRSGSEMARGLRTILFRVRQVKAEFDDGEIVDAKSISNAAKALEDVGISVRDETGDMKSMSQIMTELSAKWGTLSKAQQSYLQNYLAGNRNGNVLFALMDNWGQYEKMLQQYEESSGTALEKNTKYTESWEAATNKLSTAWLNVVSSITDAGGFIQETTSVLGDFLNWVATQDREHKKTVEEIREKTKSEAYVEHPEWRTEEENLEYARKAAEKYQEQGKKLTETIKGQTDAIVEHTEATLSDTDAVEKSATAFEKQRDRISEVAKAIKEEKDDAVNSLADIYKAAMEAADKGLWGSNAFRKGGALFFSEESLAQIKEEGKTSAREYLDAYFGEIESGDYSNAAANFFEKITGGSNEIKADNGEVLASVKDLGDAFEWTFDKGNRSMDDYLSSLSHYTGISDTFWASMIESLGLYSDEISKWTENNGEAKTEAEFDDKAAKSEAEGYIELLNSIPPFIQTTVRTVYEQSGLGAAQQAAAPKTYSWSGYGSSTQGARSATYYGKAGGKRDSYSGIALVNDEYPADGSKPELIISNSTGRAYIANGGKPALVNLASNDIVLTANETKSAFGVPGFPVGKNINFLKDAGVGGNKAIGGVGNTVSGSALKAVTPKTAPSNSGGGGGGGSSAEQASVPDPTENWNTLKKLVDYLLDKGNDDLKEQLKVLDDQLDALEAERKAQEESNKLQELQLSVDNALLDLNKAQVERTVRYYNEETKQWEWMADQKTVQDAQEAYEKALKDLNEYLADQDYAERKAAIESQKKDLQAQFDAYKDSWDAIVDAIEAPSGDIKALLADLRGTGTSTMKGQAGGIAALLNALRGGFVGSGYNFGLSNINANTSGSTTTSRTTFDSGGFAFGSGYMRKGSVGAEAVIGPDITRDILNPVRNANFATFADSVRTLVGASNMIAANGGSYVTNNSGGNIIVNGIKIGEDMMQKPFAEVMRTISLHVNEAV